VPRANRESENPRSAILADLQAVVVAARRRFLAAMGGIDALGKLHATSVAALAISQVDMAEAVRFRPGRAYGGGGSSRTSSDHGSSSAISERSRRSTGGTRRGGALDEGASAALAGVEYVSGVVKGVDRLLENLLFPSVSTAPSNPVGDEDDRRSAAGTVGTERKGKEGGSRRSGDVRGVDSVERRERREAKERRSEERRFRREGGKLNGSLDSVGSLDDGRAGDSARPGQHRASVWEEERDAKWGDSSAAAAAGPAGRRPLVLDGVQASPQDFYDMYKAASLGTGAAAGSEMEAGAGWAAAADWMGTGGAAGRSEEGGRETGGDGSARDRTNDAGWGGEGGHAWLAGGFLPPGEEGVFHPPGEEDEDAWAAGIEQWRD
ncbi:hypothetical protein T484DRAFT_1948045, partial [Baffinella frigidus]